MDAAAAVSSAGGQTRGKPRLMERLRARHVEALAKFQSTCRGASNAIDEAIFANLGTLRAQLNASRSKDEARIAEMYEANERQKKLILDFEEVLQNRKEGDVMVTFVDDIHPPGEALLTTLERREDRLEAARLAVLQLAVHLRHAHEERMNAISATEAFISNAESRRRTAVQQLLEDLLGELSTIAYVNTTVAQLLVHRAAVDVNQQLLHNNTATAELLTRLRQLDILRHRESQKSISNLYKTRRDVLANSVSLWSRQLLCTAHFRRPECRQDILRRAEATLRQTKKDSENLVSGVGLLIDTLSRHPHGIGSAISSDIPGGAVQGGWLQFFDHDATAIDPFGGGGPEDVSMQWRVAVTVVLQQLRHENGLTVERAHSAERQLQTEASHVRSIMLTDIQAIFSPTPEETHLVAQAAFDSTTPVPFDESVIADPTTAATLQAAAAEGIDPHIASLVTEGVLFVDALALNHYVRGSGLAQALLAAEGGLVPLIHDATDALYSVAADVASLIRKQRAAHDAAYKDFIDGSFRLEHAYQITEDHLVHAGTLPAAQELYMAAMDLLKRIESHYCQHHASRTGMLPKFSTELQEIFSRAQRRLEGELHVVPFAEVQAHNDALAAEVASAEANLKQLGPKERGSRLAEAQAALQAAQERALRESRPVDHDTRFAVRVGDTMIEYMALHPTHLKYGGADRKIVDPNKAKQLAPTQPTAAAKDGKGRSKLVKAADAPVLPPGPQESDGGALLELPLWTAHTRHFIGLLRDQFSPIFHDECLLSKTLLPKVVHHLRSAFLAWLNEYRVRATRHSSEFCTAVKNTLDANTNEAIRRHYRRPPTLQSLVYETRIRELQDATQSRAKYVEWIQRRIMACATKHRSDVDATRDPVASDLKQLEQLLSDLSTQDSLYAADATNRAALSCLKRVQALAADRLEASLQQTAQALEVIRRDCTTYAEERLRSFEEGGDISVDEKARGLNDIKQLVALTDSTKSDCENTVQAAREGYVKSIAASEQKYRAAYEHNVAELRFLARLHELLASAKGRLSSQIADSNASMRLLVTLVENVEGLLGATPTVLRKELAASRIIQGLDWSETSSPSPALQAMLPEMSSVPIDPPKWEQLDVCLSERLRATKVRLEAALASSRAARILAAVDELRKHMFNRGAYLGCLVYGCELSPIPPDQFFESSQVKPAETGAAAAPPPAAKSAKGKAAKMSDAPPSTGSGISDAEAWGSFARVLRWDLHFAKALQTLRESITALVDAYAAQVSTQLIRSDLYGGDITALKTAVHARLAALEKQLAAHNTAQISEYRVVVQRVHLLSQRLSSEVLTSLANLASDSIDVRAVDILTVFAAFYWSMGAARVKAAQHLKGSMNAPSSRQRLDKVSLAEQERQRKALGAVTIAGGALIREAQEEATRFASRATQGLWCVFQMLRSLVSPDHLVPGEEVVLGEHRGLKRLMRLKMKEESAKTFEPVIKTASAKGQPKVKAPPADARAKSGDRSTSKGPKADDDHDAVLLLPMLERPLVEYPGLQLNSVRPFDAWKRSHNSTFRDHYEPPSNWSDERPTTTASAPLPANDNGKKGTVPKAPLSKSAKSAPETAPPVDAEPVFSSPISAPNERVYQTGWSTCQQLIEALDALLESFAQEASTTTEKLHDAEAAWAQSWTAAVNRLVAGVAAV